MKKYISIIAVMALISAGCAKQIEQEQVVSDGNTTESGLVEYTITVSRHSEAVTKARFTSGDDVRVDFDWEVGDKIDVWDSNSGSFKTFTCTEILISGDDDARFSASLPAGTYTWTTAYYPSGIASDETHVTFPAAYSAPDKVKPILVATYPASGDMQFRHLAAYAYVTVRHCPVCADRIVFSSDQVVAGTYEVNASTQTLSSGASTSNSITISSPEVDVNRLFIPIVPGDDHTFSFEVNDATHTYFRQAGTRDFSLPRKTVINMSELVITPKVYLIADWRASQELIDDNLMTLDDYWPEIVTVEDEPVLGENRGFHYVVMFTQGLATPLEVPYGYAAESDLEAGTFVPWQTCDANLALLGLYNFSFDYASGNYSTWYKPMLYLYGIDGETTKNKAYGMERIINQIYTWFGAAAGTYVQAYDYSLTNIGPELATTPDVNNHVVVDLDALNDPTKTYSISHPSLEAVAPHYMEIVDSAHSNDMGELSWTVLSDGGFYKVENLIFDAGMFESTMTILIREERDGTTPPDYLPVYTQYGASTSGVTLADGNVIQLVQDGAPLTVTDGKYDQIYYNALNHKLYVTKK